MAHAIHLAEIDIEFIKSSSEKLIESEDKKAETISIIKEINKMKFNDNEPDTNYHNKILIIKEINNYICEYYSKNSKNLEEIVNHQCIDSINTMYSIINSYYHRND